MRSIGTAEQYYLCLNAVWFVSSSPKGPWKIVTDVPEPIYSIPPSSPVYHVTYAKVEKSSSDEVVCSYTDGYSGAYIAGVATGVALVWGTGYYYPPYIYTGPVPIYRPYYATYGVSAAYYPYAGSYAVGGYAYGPYSAAGALRGTTHRLAHMAGLTPNNILMADVRVPGATILAPTPHGRPSKGMVTMLNGVRPRSHGGDQTIQTGHVVTNYGGTGVVKGQDNLYAGHDGNVYKRDDSGDWSKWDNGQWQPVNSPSRGNEGNQPGQNNLSSQNQQTNRRDANGASSPVKQNNRRDANSTSTPGTAQNKPSPGKGRDQADKTGNSGRTRQSSDDLTNSLNREASGRQRGAQNANTQQRYQQRRTSGSSSTGQRSFRGGNTRTRRGE